MPLSLSATNLLDSTTISKFIFGVDDVTQGSLLTPQQQVAVELAANAVSSQIQRYCGYTFKQATYTEIWDGVANDEIVPRETPVTAITEIKFSPNGQWSDATSVDPNLYFISSDGIAISFRGDFLTPRGRGMIRVIYTAGYATIPADLQFAALKQFQYLYKQIGKGDAMVGLKSIQKMNEGQTKDDSIGASGLISEVEGMLKPYMRFETSRSVMFTRVT